MQDSRLLTFSEVRDLKDWAEARFGMTPDIPKTLRVHERESYMRNWLANRGMSLVADVLRELPPLRLADARTADAPPPAREPEAEWQRGSERRPGRSAPDRKAEAERRSPPQPAPAEPPRSARPEPPAAAQAPAAHIPPAYTVPRSQRGGRPLSYHERFMLRLEIWAAMGGPARGPIPPDSCEWNLETVPDVIEQHRRGAGFRVTPNLSAYAARLAEKEAETRHPRPQRFVSVEQLAQERSRRRELRIKELQEQCNDRIAALHEVLPRLAEIQREQRLLGLALVRGVLYRSSSQANLAQVGEALSLERNRILAQYRVEQAALEIDWDCPRCQNSGWLPAEIARPASPGEPETYYPPEKCQCLKREEMDDFFRAAGLQGPQQERTFDSFTLEVYPEERRQSVARVVHRCRDFTDGVIAGTQRESLVVLGHPGVGKTHLACAVAHEVIAARCTTVYLTMNDFLEIARIRTLDLTEDNRDYLRGILNADLLVLDDLGAEKVTDYSLQELMMMLNHRLNSGLPMLVTSNLSEEEIKQYYGDRIHSRLMNGCDVLYLAGDVDVRYKLRRRADR